MTHKIIKTDNYLLIVGDSEIKEGDYFYIDDTIVGTRYIYVTPVNGSKKIIAHLPLNNAPILEGVDLLPPIEDDDVEQICKEEAECVIDKGLYDISAIYDSVVDEYAQIIKRGYNKAREKFCYTEEDVIRIVEKSRQTGLTAEYLLLYSQYPTEFECEMGKDYSSFPKQGEELNSFLKPKTTTNAKGQRVWVGKYL